MLNDDSYIIEGYDLKPFKRACELPSASEAILGLNSIKYESLLFAVPSAKIWWKNNSLTLPFTNNGNRVVVYNQESLPFAVEQETWDLTKVIVHDPTLIFHLKYGIYRALMYLHDVSLHESCRLKGLGKVGKERLKDINKVIAVKIGNITKTYKKYRDQDDIYGFVPFVAREEDFGKISIIELQKNTKRFIETEYYQAKSKKQGTINKILQSYYAKAREIYEMHCRFLDLGLQEPGLNSSSSESFSTEEISDGEVEPLVITPDNVFEHILPLENFKDWGSYHAISASNDASFIEDASRQGFDGILVFDGIDLDAAIESFRLNSDYETKYGVEISESILSNLKKGETKEKAYEQILSYFKLDMVEFEKHWDQAFNDIYLSYFYFAILQFNGSFYQLKGSEYNRNYLCTINDKIYFINVCMGVRMGGFVEGQTIKEKEFPFLVEVIRYEKGEGWYFERIVLFDEEIIYKQKYGFFQGCRFVGEIFKYDIYVWGGLNYKGDFDMDDHYLPKINELFRYYENEILQRKISDPLENLVILLFGKCPKGQKYRMIDLVYRHPAENIGIDGILEMLEPLSNSYPETANKYEYFLSSLTENKPSLDTFLQIPRRLLETDSVADIPAELSLFIYYRRNLQRDFSNDLELFLVLLFGKCPRQKYPMIDLVYRHPEHTISRDEIWKTMLKPLVHRYPDTARMYAGWLQRFTQTPIDQVRYRNRDETNPQYLFTVEPFLIKGPEFERLKSATSRSKSKQVSMRKVTPSRCKKEDLFRDIVGFLLRNDQEEVGRIIESNVDDFEELSEMETGKIKNLLSVPECGIAFETSALEVFDLKGKLKRQIVYVYYGCSVKHELFSCRTPKDLIAILYIASYTGKTRSGEALYILDPQLQYLFQYGFYRWLMFIEEIEKHEETWPNSTKGKVSKELTKRLKEARKEVVPAFMSLRSMPKDLVDSWLCFLPMCPHPQASILQALRGRHEEVLEKYSLGFSEYGSFISKIKSWIESKLGKGDYRIRTVKALCSNNYRKPALLLPQIVNRKYQQRQGMQPLIIDASNCSEYLLEEGQNLFNRLAPMIALEDESIAFVQDYPRNKPRHTFNDPKEVVKKVLSRANQRLDHIMLEEEVVNEVSEEESWNYDSNLFLHLFYTGYLSDAEMAFHKFTQDYYQDIACCSKLLLSMLLEESVYKFSHNGNWKIFISFQGENVFWINVLYDYQLQYLHGTNIDIIYQGGNPSVPAIIEVLHWHYSTGFRIHEFMVFDERLKYLLGCGFWKNPNLRGCF